MLPGSELSSAAVTKSQIRVFAVQRRHETRDSMITLGGCDVRSWQRTECAPGPSHLTGLPPSSTWGGRKPGFQVEVYP